MSKITSPKEFFGFTPGDDYELAHWSKIVEYFDLLDSTSDKIKVERMEETVEGHPFLKVTITSPENLSRLDEYRRISMALSDPRGLSEEEIEKLTEDGKAVCVQAMSLHGNEVGGTQMSINLAYDLITKNDEDTLRILNEVIFIMVPCFNPDGEVQATEWYYSQKGTEYEGSDAPELFHKYAGHDNNRDAVFQHIPESRNMADILFFEWMPQAFQDHHHTGSYNARIEVVPFKDPIRQDTAPHIWRELAWYGAAITRHMEQKGLTGVSSGARFPGWQHFGFSNIVNQHNIAGMLSESATAKMATPKYIDPTQLKGNYLSLEPHTNCPSPWMGGWWHLHDITDRQYVAAYSVLDTMARNRKSVLADMARKAIYQTECGKARSEVAYIIPEAQHDTGEVRHLVRLLLRQNIEVHRATAPFFVGDTEYPKGTYVVYLAQPKFGVVKNLLGKTSFPVNRWTKNSAGVVGGYDTFTDTINEFLGVEAIEAGCQFDGDFVKIDRVEEEHVVTKASSLIIDARENSAYKTVNTILHGGGRIWRIDNENHDFYVEADAELVERALTEAPTPHTVASERPKLKSEVESLRVGVYHRYYYGNDHEGWIRLALEQYGFEYESTYDTDICGGLDNIDVLVIPHESLAFILGLEDTPAREMTAWVKWITEFGGPQPPEYRSGIGMKGVAEIKKFVERGGRLLAFNLSTNFAIEYIGVPVKNVVKGVSPALYNAHGSTLRVDIDTEDPACYGMPRETLILNYTSAAYAVTDTFNAENYRVSVRYKDKDLLRSGFLVGEEYIAKKAALVTCKKGKGEIVLYGYEPVWRAQSGGVYKTFFNKLYK